MIKHLIIASILTLPSISICQGQLMFDFVNAKAGYQSGNKTITYEGGLFEVSLKDGSFAASPCSPANPGASPVPPITQPPCPLGTNAYIFGYGEAAGMTGHWSLSAAPIGGRYFANNRPDLFQVMAAPPSLMGRPHALPVSDKSLDIGYTYTGAGGYLQYRIAEYVHRLRFLPTPSDRKRHDETVPPGNYVFGYPQKQTDQQIIAGLDPQVIPVNVVSAPLPESYPGMAQSPVKSGFRYINGEEQRDGSRTDGYWANGMLELDPVFSMRIEWQGLLDGTNTNANYDRMFLWVESSRSSNPLGGPSGNTIYPIPGLGVDYEIPIQRMLLGFEVLPPFWHNWGVGDEVVLYTRLERNYVLAGSAPILDRSFRVWGLPIRFVMTYRGFAFTQFPPDTPESLRNPNADYDQDGISNFLEYAANTDPTDITSKPPSPNYPELVPTVEAGKLTVTIQKRPDAGSSLLYELQWSSDNVNWDTIDKVNDPLWDVVETSTQLKAIVKVAGNPAVAFVRAKLTLYR